MEHYEIGLVIAAAVILLAVQWWRLARKQRQRIRDRIHNSWGNLLEREYTEADWNRICYHCEHSKTEGFVLDAITWNDLEMNRVFEQLNHCWSSAGEEYLYDLLHCPTMQSADLKKREALAAYFAAQSEVRETLEYELYGIGRTKNISVYEYLDRLMALPKQSNLIHVICIAWIVGSIVVFAFDTSAGTLSIVLAAAFSMMSYYREKAKIEAYFQCMEYLARMIRGGERIVEKLPEAPETEEAVQKLKETTEKLKPIRKGAGFLSQSTASGGNPFQIVLDYVMILFHVDLLKFNGMLRRAQGCEADGFGMLDTLGELETALSIASYRNMMLLVCTPDLKAGKDGFLEIENVWHPMLREPVPNSITADHSVLLTGSNASGKSTFLKTIAVNAVLAQTIYTVLAKSWSSSYFRVYSSMALRDSIENGESYYIVEIKSLKRILAAAEQENETPLLCFIDEVLRGTNTVERIAASSQILHTLAKKKALVFAATHDIELTELLEQEYANYHFEEEIQDGDVQFSYLLKQGKATTRNAIRLLSVMGYGENVIQAADASAAHFLETGDWRM